MKKAIYAGTFDPITVGHVDIIRRSTELFDELIVGIAESERKSPFFSLEQRMQMAELALSDFSSVKVETFSGLTIKFAASHQANYLVRGLRSAKDYEYEVEIAEMNRQMSGNILETIFLPAKIDNAFISSSIVRELILIKAFDQLGQFVPKSVFSVLEQG